jgi:hypothetical protein
MSGTYTDLEELPLADKQALAAILLRQPLVWVGGKAGCVCPGRAMHTKPNADTDCFVYVEPGAPNVDCFHSACTSTRALLTQDLQSIIGKARVSFNRTPTPTLGGSAVRTTSKSDRPVFDPDRLARIAARLPGVDADWLERRSPKRVHGRTPADFLEAVFAPGEKVAVFDEFKSIAPVIWQHPGAVSAPHALDRFCTGCRVGTWFLSNPVDGIARRVAGKEYESYTIAACITSWRHLVFETDDAPDEQWLAMLAQLPLKIVAIYTSGGRGPHALVRVDAADAGAARELSKVFQRRYVPLGACIGALTPRRLTRLPCCERLGKDAADGSYLRFDAPRLQRLLYLNPKPDGTPIAEQNIVLPGWDDRQPADQDGFNA